MSKIQSIPTGELKKYRRTLSGIILTSFWLPNLAIDAFDTRKKVVAEIKRRSRMSNNSKGGES